LGIHRAQLIVYAAIIMEAMREAWTDERLDYLNHRVDDGFKRVDERFEQVDARFEKLESKFDTRFDRIDMRFERLDTRFERLEERITSRFEWLWRLMLVSYVTALVGFFAAHS
jgi:chromosome segregation ATPase